MDSTAEFEQSASRHCEPQLSAASPIPKQNSPSVSAASSEHLYSPSSPTSSISSGGEIDCENVTEKATPEVETISKDEPKGEEPKKEAVLESPPVESVYASASVQSPDPETQDTQADSGSALPASEVCSSVKDKMAAGIPKVGYDRAEFTQCLDLLKEILNMPRITSTLSASTLLIQTQAACVAQFGLGPSYQKIFHAPDLTVNLKELLEQYEPNTVAYLVLNRALALALDTSTMASADKAVELVKHFTFIKPEQRPPSPPPMFSIFGPKKASTDDDRPSTPVDSLFRLNHKVIDKLSPSMVFSLLDVLILLAMERYDLTVMALRLVYKIYTFAIKHGLTVPDTVPGLRLRCLLVLSKEKDLNERQEFNYELRDKIGDKVFDLERDLMERAAFDGRLAEFRERHTRYEMPIVEDGGESTTTDWFNWKPKLANHKFNLQVSRDFLRMIDERHDSIIWDLARKTITHYPAKNPKELWWCFNVPSEMLLNFAMTALTLRVLDVAAETFSQLIERHPSSPFIWCRLADCFMFQHILSQDTSKEVASEKKEHVKPLPANSCDQQKAEPVQKDKEITENAQQEAQKSSSKQSPKLDSVPESPTVDDDLKLALKSYQIAINLIVRDFKAKACNETDQTEDSASSHSGESAKATVFSELDDSNADKNDQTSSCSSPTSNWKDSPAGRFFPFAQTDIAVHTLSVRLEAQMAVCVAFCHLNRGEWAETYAALSCILGESTADFTKSQVQLEIFLLAKLYAAEAQYRLGNREAAAELLDLKQNLIEYRDSRWKGMPPEDPRKDKRVVDLAALMEELSVKKDDAIFAASSTLTSSSLLESAFCFNLVSMFTTEDLSKRIAKQLSTMAPTGEANIGLVQHLAFLDHLIEVTKHRCPMTEGDVEKEKAARERTLAQLEKVIEKQKKLKNSSHKLRDASLAGKSDSTDENDKEVSEILRDKYDDLDISAIFDEIDSLKTPSPSPLPLNSFDAQYLPTFVETSPNCQFGSSLFVATPEQPPEVLSPLRHHMILARYIDQQPAAPPGTTFGAIGAPPKSVSAFSANTPQYSSEGTSKSQPTFQRSSDAINDLYAADWAKPGGRSTRSNSAGKGQWTQSSQSKQSRQAHQAQRHAQEDQHPKQTQPESQRQQAQHSQHSQPANQQTQPESQQIQHQTQQIQLQTQQSQQSQQPAQSQSQQSPPETVQHNNNNNKLQHFPDYFSSEPQPFHAQNRSIPDYFSSDFSHQVHQRQITDYFLPEPKKPPQQNSRFLELFAQKHAKAQAEKQRQAQEQFQQQQQQQQHQPSPYEVPSAFSAGRPIYGTGQNTDHPEDTAVSEAFLAFQQIKLQEQMHEQQLQQQQLIQEQQMQELQEKQKIEQAKMQLSYLSQMAHSGPMNPLDVASFSDVVALQQQQQFPVSPNQSYDFPNQQLSPFPDVGLSPHTFGPLAPLQQQQFSSPPVPVVSAFPSSPSFHGPLSQVTASFSGSQQFQSATMHSQSSNGFSQQFNAVMSQSASGSLSQQNSPSGGPNNANPNPQMMLSMLSLCPNMSDFLQQQQQQLQQQQQQQLQQQQQQIQQQQQSQHLTQQEFTSTNWSPDDSFGPPMMQQQQQSPQQNFNTFERMPNYMERSASFFNLPQHQQPTAQSQRMQRINTYAETTMGGSTFGGNLGASPRDDGHSPNSNSMYPGNGGHPYQRSTSVGLPGAMGQTRGGPSFGHFETEQMTTTSVEAIQQVGNRIWSSSVSYSSATLGDRSHGMQGVQDAPVLGNGHLMFPDRPPMQTSPFQQQQQQPPQPQTVVHPNGRPVIRPPPGLSQSHLPSSLSQRVIPPISNTTNAANLVVNTMMSVPLGSALSPRSNSASRLFGGITTRR